jgi:DNA-directed RNA polymerase
VADQFPTQVHKQLVAVHLMVVWQIAITQDHTIKEVGDQTLRQIQDQVGAMLQIHRTQTVGIIITQEAVRIQASSITAIHEVHPIGLVEIAM